MRLPPALSLSFPPRSLGFAPPLEPGGPEVPATELTLGPLVLGVALLIVLAGAIVAHWLVRRRRLKALGKSP